MSTNTATESQNKRTRPIDVSIATRPNNLEAVPELVKEILSDVHGLEAGNDVDRKDLIVKCRTLLRSVETPRETMATHLWGETGALSGISWGVDCGLWVRMAKDGDQPQKVAVLAEELSVDPLLLARIMRHLAAMGLLVEVGEDEYKPTNYTRALSLPQIGNGYLGLVSSASAGIMRFHEFSRLNGWVNPSDCFNTSNMYAHETDKDFFDWVQSVGYGTHLNDYLGGYNLCRPHWMHEEVYPVQERLIQGADTNPEAPFMVDIAGNVGHDLERFLQHHPDVTGKLILQDLPAVIKDIKELDPRIVRMEHDFLTEQPVKGARAYYIHSSLHNWSDSICEIILAKTRQAMKPGYSRLLINENVIPRRGAHWEMTGMDMMMLTLFSGEERTLEMWTDLIEKKAGLRIVKIYDGGKNVESVIECERIERPGRL